MENAISITTKRCIRCGRELSLDHFHKSAKSHDGLQSWCKECKSEYSREQVLKQLNKPTTKKPNGNSDLGNYTDAQLVSELTRRQDFNINDHFSPRTLINALYDLGYRGELKIMVEHTVRLSHE